MEKIKEKRRQLRKDALHEDDDEDVLSTSQHFRDEDDEEEELDDVEDEDDLDHAGNKYLQKHQELRFVPGEGESVIFVDEEDEEPHETHYFSRRAYLEDEAEKVIQSFSPSEIRLILGDSV